MTVIKICGVTTVDDAVAAVQAGADMIGINFYEPSVRFVTLEQARCITQALRNSPGLSCPVLVGLFVNAATGYIRGVVDDLSLDLAQLSGDESPEEVAALGGVGLKSIRPQSQEEAVQLASVFGACGPAWEWAPSLIVDAYQEHLYGGTGRQARPEISRAARVVVPRLMLAGGLAQENVAGAVRAIRPWGVDVASGVEGELKGRKDVDRMRAFVKAVREIDAAL